MREREKGREKESESESRRDRESDTPRSEDRVTVLNRSDLHYRRMIVELLIF